MNQRQKALAEKTIKIKFNGTIAELRAATTVAEKDNPALPLLPSLSCGLPSGFKLGMDDDESGYSAYGRSARGHAPLLQDGQTWPDEVKKLAPELDTLIKAAVALFDDMNKAVTDANLITIDENVRRKEIRSGAARARTVLCSELAAERDDTILDIAFKGEDQEMLDFLKSLPTPQSISRRLEKVDMHLTKLLPTITGIGEKIPAHLSQSNVTVKIAVDTQDASDEPPVS